MIYWSGGPRGLQQNKMARLNLAVVILVGVVFICLGEEVEHITDIIKIFVFLNIVLASLADLSLQRVQEEVLVQRQGQAGAVAKAEEEVAVPEDQGRRVAVTGRQVRRAARAGRQRGEEGKIM